MANSRTKARAKSQETRNNIIAVAIGLFRAKGYARTSMSEIARQAGVDPSSFYYYFASKEALIEYADKILLTISSAKILNCVAN